MMKGTILKCELEDHIEHQKMEIRSEAKFSQLE